MAFKFHDFECVRCGHTWEEMVWHADPNPRHCGQESKRLIATPKIANMKMGVDPYGCPTAGEKWAKAHENRKAQATGNLTDV